MPQSILTHHPDANDYIKGARDNQDAREAANRYFADLAALRDGKATSVAARPRIGAKRPRVGVSYDECAPRSSSPARGVDCLPGDDCADVPDLCGGDVLGFNSLGIAPFPLTAVTPGVPVTGALVVGSGNACAFKPRKFFFEMRDSAVAAFPVIPGLLVSARIAGQEQLVSDVVANGIPSAVFALTCEPLPVRWSKFTNTGQHQLTLTFGEFLGGAVTGHAFGAAWGERTA